MSERNSKYNRQGHMFHVTAGPFKGSEGLLQGVRSDGGELVWPDRPDGDWKEVVRLWFAWEHIEEVSGQGGEDA